jgi:flagellin-like hook-associated protein FlgL
VSSNAAAFSAKLTGAAKGDKISFDIGGGGASFQLGKDVTSVNRLNIGLQDVRTVNIGGSTGKLSDLRSLDYNDNADLSKALAIAQEAIKDVSSARGRIGTAQNLMGANRENLEDQLVVITHAEAEISNTNVAEESSRLARYELIAQSAVNSIQYSRAFASFAVSSLFCP